MYRLAVEKDFDAAHFLRGYQGRCEALHGHRFRVVLRVEAAALDELGMACDFTVLKKHLAEVLARYDHTCLNDIVPFDTINPSSENLARTIYEEMRPRLAEAPVMLAAVEVWESPESRAAYCPD